MISMARIDIDRRDRTIIFNVRRNANRAMRAAMPEQTTNSSLARGAASGAAFVCAVATGLVLDSVGRPSTLGRALASTMIATCLLQVMRSPVPFEARYIRWIEWRQHAADFVVAAMGLWVVRYLFPTGDVLSCQPLVPWRIPVALFGAFTTSWLTRAITLRMQPPSITVLIFLRVCPGTSS